MNGYISLSPRIQPKWNSLMLVEDDNLSDYFIYHNKEEYSLDNKEENVKKD